MSSYFCRSLRFTALLLPFIWCTIGVFYTVVPFVVITSMHSATVDAPTLCIYPLAGFQCVPLQTGFDSLALPLYCSILHILLAQDPLSLSLAEVVHGMCHPGRNCSLLLTIPSYHRHSALLQQVTSSGASSITQPSIFTCVNGENSVLKTVLSSPTAKRGVSPSNQCILRNRNL